MDVADDADGRVAIFSIAEPPRASEVAPAPSGQVASAGPTRLGQILDSRYAVMGVGAALVVILVLGLVFARH